MKPSPTQAIITGFFTFVICLFFLLSIAPAFRSQSRAIYRTKAINNLRQIGIALNDFDSNYNTFPQQELPPEFLEENPDFKAQDRSDSNYLLGHLIRTKCVDTEQIFSFGHSKKNNQHDDFSTEDRLLEAGECQYSYISAAGGEPLTASTTTSEMPLAFAAVIPRTGQFDRNAFDNRAVYLRGDNSVGSTHRRDDPQRDADPPWPHRSHSKKLRYQHLQRRIRLPPRRQQRRNGKTRQSNRNSAHTH